MLLQGSRASPKKHNMKREAANGKESMRRQQRDETESGGLTRWFSATSRLWLAFYNRNSTLHENIHFHVESSGVCFCRFSSSYRQPPWVYPPCMLWLPEGSAQARRLPTLANSRRSIPSSPAASSAWGRARLGPGTGFLLANLGFRGFRAKSFKNRIFNGFSGVGRGLDE